MQAERRLVIELPAWVDELANRQRAYPGLEDRMRLAAVLARENVLRGSGGPFGAAVFEIESGRLVAAGVNLVVPCSNSVLHAEVLALMLAESQLQSYTLRAPGMPWHELVTSCEPCAMCLGAVLWSGVSRLVAGALREDAGRVGFEEGPVFPQSYRYLEDQGIQVVRGVLRDECVQILHLYQQRGGVIYNG